ncbi:hypothetical protein J1N35_011443 [Gossypium stocksii]|uniref:Uncharacterized protein n=1 Tax=Gossypium stocksii TaxID=47602 RepID=A0A9D3W413_9ROSI|nr:hypothetical protein J1N35_011443 [Gossypium stocksii]
MVKVLWKSIGFLGTKEITMESSDDQPEERSGRVPAEIERIISTPKFKQHRVLAVWDFSPGCERVTALNFGLSRQIAVNQSSQGKW